MNRNASQPDACEMDHASYPRLRGALASRAAAFVILLWLAQPPGMAWPLAMIALVPLLDLIDFPGQLSRRDYFLLWGISALYWLVSLQGLRHAHPAMVLCLIALAGYLAVYHVLFVILLRNATALCPTAFKESSPRIAIVAFAAVIWVGLEWFRNYLLTGISVLMLGHTLADVPPMIQMADLFGTYGVSFVLVQVNVAVWFVLRRYVSSRRFFSHTGSIPILRIELVAAGASAGVLLLATLAYGSFRLSQPLSDANETFALIQRDEEVEYVQTEDRQVEIFRNYVNQSLKTLKGTAEEVDAVIWPESMFSGGQPCVIVAPNAKVPESPDGPPISRREFLRWVQSRQEYFLRRAGYVQRELAKENPSQRAPDLIVGCGVIRYADRPEMYSGVVQLQSNFEVSSSEESTTKVTKWYGKTHLVMFGEYIPVLPWIPVLRSWIPEGMGLNVGPKPQRMTVGETIIAPNICVETAVERVCVNQMRSLGSDGSLPNLIVTVTNDGWFDNSSVLDHHLRCAQLVAVGCRRPILSTANNGPTAWIDSSGRIVDRLATGENGAIIAKPKRDNRVTAYVQISDWPATLCAVICLAIPIVRRWRHVGANASSKRK